MFITKVVLGISYLLHNLLHLVSYDCFPLISRISHLIIALRLQST
jgi:hypothetical protein